MKKFANKSLAVLFSVFVLAMCLSVSAASSVAAAPASNKTPSPTATPNSDAWLVNQVRHELVMLPWLSVFDNLQYEVRGNKVILSGEVVRPVLKDSAASVVKRIAGVQEVENRIDVLPVSPFDNQIRRAELREIYSYPALQRYGLGTLPSIHIIVNNGHVTLEGAVDNQMDKNLAGIRANSVPDVFSVTNNLQVQGAR
jgi:hyperosmotically inducible periplasmic protein